MLKGRKNTSCVVFSGRGADAANPRVQFDEGEVETEGWGDTRAPATERAGNTQGFPKLPRHLPTLLLPNAIVPAPSSSADITFSLGSFRAQPGHHRRPAAGADRPPRDSARSWRKRPSAS